MGELKIDRNAPDINNLTFEAFEIDDSDNDCLKGKDTQENSTYVLIGLSGQDVLVGARRTNKVREVEINLPGKDGERVIGDRAGDDDCTLINKFDLVGMVKGKNKLDLDASYFEFSS